MSVFLSVVVATRNHAASLQQMLACLLIQEGAPPHEIIVVDNGSTDDTPRVVHAHERVHYFYAPQGGKSTAVNAGLARTRGEVLIFVDDDMTFGPTWLGAHAKAYEEHPDAWLVGGRTRLGQEDLPSWYVSRPNMPPAWWLFGPACEYGEVTIQLQSPQYVAGNNMSCRRATIERIGAFREDIGHRPGRRAVGSEDHELCRRVYGAGGTIYYCADAVAWHPITPERRSLKSVRGFAFVYGRELFIDQQGPPFSPVVAAKDLVKSLAHYAHGDFGGGLRHELAVRRAFGYFYQRMLRGRPS
jgi:glucosyl-dolichyl phosphate glucuronosyltransferase